MKIFSSMVGLLIALVAILGLVYSGMEGGFGRFQVWFPLTVILIGAVVSVSQMSKSGYTNDAAAVAKAKRGLIRAVGYGLVAGVVVAGLFYLLLK
jgi:hypothetical protein